MSRTRSSALRAGTRQLPARAARVRATPSRDKRQRRLQETAQASFDAWTAVADSPSASAARRGRRVVLVTVAAAGALSRSMQTRARRSGPASQFLRSRRNNEGSRCPEIRGNGEAELRDRPAAGLLQQLQQTATWCARSLTSPRRAHGQGKQTGVGAGMFGGAGLFGLYAGRADRLRDPAAQQR
jgi:hypothetical protein